MPNKLNHALHIKIQLDLEFLVHIYLNEYQYCFLFRIFSALEL